MRQRRRGANLETRQPLRSPHGPIRVACFIFITASRYADDFNIQPEAFVAGLANTI